MKITKSKKQTPPPAQGRVSFGLLDPAFVYVCAAKTDIRATFARARTAQAALKISASAVVA